MPKQTNEAFDCPPEMLGRLGAALWSRVGEAFRFDHLFWADDLLGEGGQKRLHQAIVTAGIIKNHQLDPARLSGWLLHLSGKSSEVLWTLPEWHPNHTTLGRSYLSKLANLIGQAQEELVLVSPYLQLNGMVHLQKPLLEALKRHVKLQVVTHDLTDIKSQASQALEELRREAERMQADFTAYQVKPEGGLIHAKILLVDQKWAVLGSANLTGPGLTSNFEAGVFLRETQAWECRLMVEQLLSSALVNKQFATAPQVQ